MPTFLTGLSLRAWLRIATGLAFALLLAWALRLDNRREHWHNVAQAFAKKAGAVVVALEEATGEPARWETAPGQILVLGQGIKDRDNRIAATNAAIDEMAREAVRLKAQAAELQRIADKAQAQRRAALARLSDMAITPGSRSDCLQLLREADEALNLVREAGA